MRCLGDVSYVVECGCCRVISQTVDGVFGDGVTWLVWWWLGWGGDYFVAWMNEHGGVGLIYGLDTFILLDWLDVVS